LDRQFKFHKRRQLFIRTHNETFSVVAIPVNNKGLDIVDALRVKGVPHEKFSEN
jgi:hypothetical protein